VATGSAGAVSPTAWLVSVLAAAAGLIIHLKGPVSVGTAEV